MSAGGPLAGLRAIELGEGTSAPYAAKLLADYGAEVVKVEPPGGDPARRRGPFPGDRPDPEASGLFLYLNTNKYGVVLDLDSDTGRRQLELLLAQADILVSNLSTQRLAAMSAAPAVLRARHPALIIATITPFGADGPWAARRGDDLVIYAMGGLAYSTPGMPDAAEELEKEPPLHPAGFPAETLAGLAAATAILSAVHQRARTGGGNHLELSQHATVATMQHRDVTTYSYRGGTYNRLLNPVTIGRMPNFYLPCKDGYVTIAAPMDLHWERLVEAMGNPPWALSADFATSTARSANWMELRRRLVEWTLELSGDELYALADARQLPFFPFYPVRKAVDSEHSRARESVVGLRVGTRRARMPGAPFRMEKTPWALRRPAPRLGEHTEQILQQCSRAASSPSRALEQVRSALPLTGIRVLDLGQYIAMPYCTLWLAWLGAEVIAIESRRHMTSRSAPPFAPGLEGNPDASGYYNLLYSSKKSCTVDMRTPGGRAVARRIAGAVDVMVDNFSTGVLEKLGLSYDEVAKENPGLIAVSCGAFGRSGPMKQARGLHSAVNLFSGVADVTGYPGGHPRILGGVLPDPLSGIYGAFAILAALHHRRRTGEGQFVDLAMYEAMMTLIPEAVIDLDLNGRDPVRIGNRDRLKVPHGIYRCREPESWIAISVDSDSEWQALCEAAGHNDWRADPRFRDVAARRAHAAEIDRVVDAWTRTLRVDEATTLLQSRGVAAGPVRRCDELLNDEILLQRGAIFATEHPVAGVRRQIGLPWKSDSSAFDYRRAPLLGEHTRPVLSSLLGMDDDEYARLQAHGVFS